MTLAVISSTPMDFVKSPTPVSDLMRRLGGRKDLMEADYEEREPEWGSLDILEACGASDPDSNSGSGIYLRPKEERMVNRKWWRKFPIQLAIILAVGTLVVDLAFWVAALDVTTCSCGHWATSPPGRYYPWPAEPGPMEVTSPMNPIDSATCFAATTGLIVFFIAGDVIVLAFIGRFIGRRIERWRENRK